MATLAVSFFRLAEAYKEHIYTKLQELVPDRLARPNQGIVMGKTTNEVLAIVYIQGVAEALNAFGAAELLRTQGGAVPTDLTA